MKSDGALSCGRAKTSTQLKRNGALVKVCELLKKDPRCKNQKVEICWQKNDVKDKDRSVVIDEKPIFIQKKTDLIGSMDAQFQDISI